MNATTTVYCSVETMKKFNQFAKEEALAKGKILEKMVELYESKRAEEMIRKT